MKTVPERLLAHLLSEGLYNDDHTEELYREAHRLDDEATIDSDAVSRWAVETAQAQALKGER